MRALVALASLAATACASSISAGSESLRKSVVARFSASDAPSARPSPVRCAASSPSREGRWSSAPPLLGSALGPRPFNAGFSSLPAGRPDAVTRERARLPSQKASKMPSNLSHSALRAQNRCLKAERSSPGLAP